MGYIDKYKDFDAIIEEKFRAIEGKVDFFKIPYQFNDINEKFENLNKKFEETEKDMTKIKHENRYLQRKLKDLADSKLPQQGAPEEFQLATPPIATVSKARCPECDANYTTDSEFCRNCSRKRTSEDGSQPGSQDGSSDAGSMPALEPVEEPGVRAR